MAATLTDNRLLVTARDQRQARDVLGDLAGPEGFLAVGHAADEGQRRPVPRELGQLVQQILQAVASGSTVTVSAIPAELTTVSAAALLGVSRPTLMKMVQAGEIPAHKVGSHTRLRAADVLEFVRLRQERQRAAFDQLRELLDD